MKFFARLEKTTTTWLLILVCVIFALLRLPSIIEPYWYGDEGIYEVVGQAMNHGHLLYRDIWDNKPPLLYVIYYFANGDQATVKIFSLIVGLMTIIAFYFLSQKVFNKQKISITLTSIFALLFATPLLEANIANAEDFILLPVIIAGILIYDASKINKTINFSFLGSGNGRVFLKTIEFKYLLAGLLLGVAFLFKIVAVFDLAAFLTFVIILKLPKNLSSSQYKKTDRNVSGIMNYKLWKTIILPNSFFIILGFLVPFFLTILYFASNYALPDFFQSVFAGNVDYVGWQNNLLGVPQGLLLIKILLLGGGITLLLTNRKRLTEPALFVLTWLLFSLFNVYFSGRPYTHYAIVLLPSFCLFIGTFFTFDSLLNKTRILVTLLILSVALFYQFRFNFTGSFLYYQNVIAFLNNQKSIDAYRSFFDQKTPRDYAVANFISTQTKASDSIFVWGNNPEIYALSNKTPIGKYAVAYHIYQNNAFNETQNELNTKKPKYIIVLKESQPLPFTIPIYIMRYNISGATIYERSF
jgi:hypothetical protein